jgi:predicted RNA-binding Zn ribbon-like protein
MTESVREAPVYADALALDLANTVYMSRGKDLDALVDPEDLQKWTGRVAPRLPVSPDAEWADRLSADDGDLEQFRTLRDAIRSVAADVVTGKPPAAMHVEAMNAAAALAPRRTVLSLAPDGTLHKDAVSDAPTMQTVLSALAEDAIDLFGGDRRHQLRACQAPNCPLYFLKDHARREWCGPSCGNRVRAARAYRKRTGATPGTASTK